MKRSRLVLVVILVAVTALVTALWVGEGPLWRWVMIHRVDLDSLSPDLIIGGEKVRGWAEVRRFASIRYASTPPGNPADLSINYHGDVVAWYRATGLKAMEDTPSSCPRNVIRSRWDSAFR